MAPSRAGKQSNFFALREQMGTNQGQVPTKNERSQSFAVNEVKVDRRNFSFNPKNLLLKEKSRFTSMKQAEIDHATQQ